MPEPFAALLSAGPPLEPRILSSLVWYLCDLKSGQVLTDLPLKPSGDLESTVGAYTSLDVTLDVADERCPADWYSLIDPRRSMIVVCDDDLPLLGYIVNVPQMGAPTATFSLSSLEACMDRVYVRDHDFYLDEDDEADVVAALLDDVIVPSFGFTVEYTSTGQTGDHSYAYAEDRTVYSALTDLMSAEGGPEWRIRLDWTDATHQVLTKVIEVAAHVGSVQAEAVFDDLIISDRKRRVDYGPGMGATLVVAVSDGSGSERPMSDDYADGDALDAGIPQWEARVSVTAVDDPAQLNRIADAGLTRRANGVTTWEIECAATEPSCPRVGRSFTAGDTVTVDLGPGQFDPAEWHGPARLLGWRASVSGDTISTITPVLWQTPEDVSGA